MPNSMKKPDPSASNPGSTPGLKITLKSLRNPPLSLSLSSQSSATSIFELKTAVAKNLGLEGGRVDSVRILYKKKPCPDSKTVKDLVGDEVAGGAEVEFSVMIIGGAQGHENSVPGVEGGNGSPPVAQGPTGDSVLATDEFWQDLKGYLTQRLRDEEKADSVWRSFKQVWTNQGTRDS